MPDGIHNVIINTKYPYNTIIKDIWQWDKGQSIVFSGMDLTANYEVHFKYSALNDTEEEIIPTTAVVPVEDNKVEIPDEALIYFERVYGFLYYRDENGILGETLARVDIEILKKDMPFDYVGSNNRKTLNDYFNIMVEDINDFPSDIVNGTKAILKSIIDDEISYILYIKDTDGWHVLHDRIPSIEIDPITFNLIIDGVDTGVCTKGIDGLTPEIGENGNWYIGGMDTGILAVGEIVEFVDNVAAPYTGKAFRVLQGGSPEEVHIFGQTALELEDIAVKRELLDPKDIYPAQSKSLSSGFFAQLDGQGTIVKGILVYVISDTEEDEISVRSIHIISFGQFEWEKGGLLLESYAYFFNSGIFSQFNDEPIEVTAGWHSFDLSTGELIPCEYEDVPVFTDYLFANGTNAEALGGDIPEEFVAVHPEYLGYWFTNGTVGTNSLYAWNTETEEYVLVSGSDVPDGVLTAENIVEFVDNVAAPYTGKTFRVLNNSFYAWGQDMNPENIYMRSGELANPADIFTAYNLENNTDVHLTKAAFERISTNELIFIGACDGTVESVFSINVPHCFIFLYNNMNIVLILIKIYEETNLGKEEDPVILEPGCYQIINDTPVPIDPADIPYFGGFRLISDTWYQDIDENHESILPELLGHWFINTNTKPLYVYNGSSYELVGGDGTTSPITVEIDDEGYWVINGVVTTRKAVPANGTTPTITIDQNTKHFIINGVDTNIKAEGVDGETPTVTIDPITFNLFINDVDTGICTKPVDGQDGKDGISPTITLGTVTRGTAFAVSNSGTAQDIILNITDDSLIPKTLLTGWTLESNKSYYRNVLESGTFILPTVNELNLNIENIISLELNVFNVSVGFGESIRFADSVIPNLTGGSWFVEYRWSNTFSCWVVTAVKFGLVI